ncbi:concanavalin A-like lectin/glucanase, partial [Pestalotiopsis sp. NC0098]
MATTLLKYVALAAGTFAATAGATQSYAVTEVYNATNFFDKFGHFVTPLDVDPTSGYVQYLDRADAIKSGLMSIDGDEVYVGPDTSQTYDPYGYGRKSVRLESLSTYNHGLFIADFTHLPAPTCGAWPSFWMFGAPWPTKGEIDIVENWNDLEFNRNTAHVDSPDVIGECTIKPLDMTARLIESTNCYDGTPGQYDNQGCSADSYGLPFGLSEGGVYALEWTSDYLKIWSWTRALAPPDIQLGNPLPSNWSVPNFMITDCNVDQAFQDMKLVLNIDFCGVAGVDGIWNSCKASTGYDTCTGYVAENPEAFKDSYFKIADFKVYEQ